MKTRTFLRKLFLPLMILGAVAIPAAVVSPALATNNDFGTCAASMPPSNDYLYCNLFPAINAGFNMRGTHSWSSFSFEVYFESSDGIFHGPYGPWSRTGVNYGTSNIGVPVWAWAVRSLVKNNTSSVDQMVGGWRS